MEGKMVKLPVQLVREPIEPVDNDIKTFYERLLAATNDPAFHDGEWHICEVVSLTDKSHSQVLAWSWQHKEKIKVVIVNYASEETQTIIKPPVSLGNGQDLFIQDMLTGQKPQYSFPENGLRVSLNPFQVFILDLSV
jgi:hypothetical protein